MTSRTGNPGSVPRCVYFITHPDVVVDPAVPVPRWPLSERGRRRMRALLAAPWVRDVGMVFCSTEQKAIDGAAILAEHVGVPCAELPELSENDRSATGYLPASEFQATADAFFARPFERVRGWERAIDAQQRIVRAIERAHALVSSPQPVAIVSHGGVGTLLLCHLKGVAISRREEQPGTAGGNYFAFALPAGTLVHGWRPIDAEGPG